jgi:hypothetical protein
MIQVIGTVVFGCMILMYWQDHGASDKDEPRSAALTRIVIALLCGWVITMLMLEWGLFRGPYEREPHM